MNLFRSKESQLSKLNIAEISGKVTSILAALSAIISILNFLISGMCFTKTIPMDLIDNFLLQIIIFIFVEALIGNFFALLLIRLHYKYRSGLWYFFMIIGCIFSAWTSIFNVKWIILRGIQPSTSEDFNLFWFFSLISWMIALYFIKYHGKFDFEHTNNISIMSLLFGTGEHLLSGNTKKYRKVMKWQTISFSLICVLR